MRRTELRRGTGLSRSVPKPARRRDTGPSAKVRKLVLTRDGYRCVACGVSIIGRLYSLQHRDARGMGGTSDPAANSPVNLVVLCGWRDTPGSCHKRAEDRDPEMNARGYWLRNGEDPALTPVMVFSPAGSGAAVWLSPAGAYLSEPPEGAAA